MTETRVRRRRARRRPGASRKVFAIAAGAVVVGVGLTGTLAAWTDTEWVFGGLGTEDGAGDPGDGPIGTSTFEVLQNTFNPVSAWVDAETEPGSEILFTADGASLSPGDATYAEVALKTDADSVGGALTLTAATPYSSAGDADDLLFNAMEVRVFTSTSDIACTAAGVAALTPIMNGGLGTAAATGSQTLAAAGGSVQYYCFELSLPSPLVPAEDTEVEDYMGRTIVPTWKFDAESS